MKNFFTLIFTWTAFSLCATFAEAQSCQTANLIMESNTSGGGPTFASWTVYALNQQVMGNGMAQFSGDHPHYDHNLCLSPGCYVAVINPALIPQNPEMFSVGVNVNGQPLTLQNYTVISGAIGFQFCIAAYDCPQSVEVTSVDCDSFLFSLPGDAPESSANWSFGDGVMENGSPVADHSYSENGEYTVIAIYDGPNCPGPYTVTATVEVDCQEEPVCPSLLEVGQQTCGTYTIHVAGAWPNESATKWYINDGVEPVATGASYVYQPSQPGCKTIYAKYNSEACGQIVLSKQICFEGCQESQCPDEIHAITYGTCGHYGFEIGSFVNGENVVWNFGDGPNQTGGHFIQHAYTQGGQYTVHAYYTSSTCPNVVHLELAVSVPNCSEECPALIEGSSSVCGVFQLHIAGAWPNESASVWYINNSQIAAGTGSSFVFQPGEAGCYTIKAVYHSESCGQVTLIKQVCFEGCVDQDCPTSLWASEGDCGAYNFEAGSFQAGESVDWHFGELIVENQGHFIHHEFEQEGPVEVCAFFTSQACPSGVSVCTIVNVDLCDGEDCHLELQAGQLEANQWAFHASGSPETEQLLWTIDGGTPFTGGWNMTEHLSPGQHTICAKLISTECPEGVIKCVSVYQEPLPTCISGVFSIDSFMEHDGSSSIEWWLVNSEAQIIHDGVAQYSGNDPWFDKQLCLPEGCYKLYGCGNSVANPTNLHVLVNSQWDLVSLQYVNNEECSGFMAIISVGEGCDDIEPSCSADFTPVFTQVAGHIEFENTSEWSGDASFSWSYGDGQFSDGQGGNVYYASNGTYTVCLTMTTSQGCTSTHCEEVVVDEMEGGCGAQEVLIHLEGEYPDQQTIDVLQLVLLANGFEIGDFDMVLSGSFDLDVALCLAEGCYEFEVNSLAPLAASLLEIEITVNGVPVDPLQLLQGTSGGSIVVGVGTDCTVGITNTDFQHNGWAVYPNPANQFVTLSSGDIETCSWQIMDISGRTVHSGSVPSSSSTVDTGDLSPGMYFVRLAGSQEIKRIEIIR